MKFFRSFLFFILFLIPLRFLFASDHVLISQFQVSGASSTDEFIELYNPTNRDIDLFDYKIQKKTNSGTVYNIISSFPEKSIIKAFSYFLISHQNFSKADFVKPDLVYSSFSIANDNSIVLMDSDANVLDVVGYGNCLVFEQSCIQNILSNQSYIRANDYNNYGIGYGYGYGSSFFDCSSFDTDNNINDFIMLSKANPRNSNFINQCKYTSSIVTINNQYNNHESSNVSEINNDSSIPADEDVYNSIFPFNNIKDSNTVFYEPPIFNEDILDSNLMLLDTPVLKTLDKSLELLSDSPKDIVLNKIDASKVVSNKDNILDIEDVKNMNIGDSVNVRGSVVSLPGLFLKNSFYVDGVQVYNSKSDFPDLKVGDNIYVSGIISSNYGEKRIKVKSKNDIRIISRNNKVDFIDLVNDEEDFVNITSRLVYLSGEVSKKSGSKFFILNNDIETEVYVYKNTGIDYKKIKIGDNLGVYGVLNLKNDEYRILPRNDSDIIVIDLIQDDVSNNVEAAALGIDNSMSSNEDKLNTKDEKLKIVDDKINPSLSSYKIENKNNSLNYIKYFLIGIFLFLLFIFVLFLYKTGLLMKIKLFFNLLLIGIKQK